MAYRNITEIIEIRKNIHRENMRKAGFSEKKIKRIVNKERYLHIP